ncbi:AraC family transcriptional regulator [Cohnella herbarum]|uniref:AraC family transcriptional regulator n=1 Tax=Cohnella herbarum TaxID=2728023 RepID=A0A7Z2ZNN5_9BACL|nr:AraC family transcriptional regulator [Cohnella herbarum]QJD86030.1 AraC family transcriptional regulator [Cohnella herbarum]
MSKPPSANEGVFLAPNTLYMPVRLSGLDKISVFNDREEPGNFYRVILVWGGEGLLYVNDVPHELSRGSVFLCDAMPRLRSDPQSALRGIQIEYRILTADGSKPRGLEHPVPLKRCASGILRLAAELESAWKAPQPGDPVRTQQLFIEWLAELINEMNVRQRPADSWLGQVLHYMETHFNKELTRERMAEYANVSPEHFSRIFRRHTGRTFSAHLTLLRIRRSAVLVL